MLVPLRDSGKKAMVCWLLISSLLGIAEFKGTRGHSGRGPNADCRMRTLKGGQNWRYSLGNHPDGRLRVKTPGADMLLSKESVYLGKKTKGRNLNPPLVLR